MVTLRPKRRMRVFLQRKSIISRSIFEKPIVFSYNHRSIPKRQWERWFVFQRTRQDTSVWKLPWIWFQNDCSETSSEQRSYSKSSKREEGENEELMRTGKRIFELMSMLKRKTCFQKRNEMYPRSKDVYQLVFSYTNNERNLHVGCRSKGNFHFILTGICGKLLIELSPLSMSMLLSVVYLYSNQTPASILFFIEK